MSIPAPGYLWRLIDALHRPINQPIGPIQLDTADADWLYEHLLTIATKPPVREGAPSRNNHCIWVAVHVQMLRLAQRGKKPWKVAYSDAAEFWGVKEKQVEEWERKLRGDAKRLIATAGYEPIARLIKRNRDVYQKKSV